jgi:hypothetical protein
LGVSVLSAQLHLRDIEYLDPLLATSICRNKRDLEERDPRVVRIYRTDRFAERQPPFYSV